MGTSVPLAAVTASRSTSAEPALPLTATRLQPAPMPCSKAGPPQRMLVSLSAVRVKHSDYWKSLAQPLWTDFSAADGVSV